LQGTVDGLRVSAPINLPFTVEFWVWIAKDSPPQSAFLGQDSYNRKSGLSLMLDNNLITWGFMENFITGQREIAR
jgi:hypothetical protein